MDFGESEGSSVCLAWADWWADVANVAELGGEPDQATTKRLYEAWVQRLDHEIEIRSAAGEEYSAGNRERTLMVSLSQEALERRVSALVKKWLGLAIPICWLVNRFSWAVHVPAPAHELLVGVDDDGRLVRRGTSSPTPIEDVRLYELLNPPRSLIFARCENPKCKRIFARRGRAKRCSLKCTQKVNDAKRAETEHRKQQVKIAGEKHRTTSSRTGPRKD
jgi:hypothetical protein